MRLVEPKAELIKQETGIEGVYKMIELAGRTCYKSEHLITSGSAEKFVERMINLGHGAMLEHGTVYLLTTQGIEFVEFNQKYANNKYSIVNVNPYNNDVCITTNLRVLVENNWMDDLQYMTDPTTYHQERITFRITMDRIGSQSFCRHRVFSFAQESTRYCNYNKDKFGGEIAISVPTWLMGKNELEDIGEVELVELLDICHNVDLDPIFYWEVANRVAEFSYLNLVRLGWTPEKARSILPADLNTEIVMTGTIDQWKGFLKLRDDSHAHPDAQFMAKIIKEKLFNETTLNSEL